MAEPIEFSAAVTGEAGYGTNPFLRPDINLGAPFVAGTFSPKLSYKTARSSTTFTSVYHREQYLRRFGHIDTLNTGIERIDQLNERLSSTVSANYVTTNNASVGDPTAAIIDPLNIGRRTRQLTGRYDLQWVASASDHFTYGAQVSHESYGKGKGALATLRPSGYTQLGVNVGYDHVLDARTSIGAQVSLSSVTSKLYPDSRTIQPALTAKRQLNAIWVIDGHLGLLMQHVAGPFAASSTSLGYGVNLCGTYPRTTFCFSSERSVVPSGYGPSRTTTSVRGSVVHKLSELSRVNLSAAYTKTGSAAAFSQSSPFSSIGSTHALQVTGTYDRDLTQRLSAGFGGSYRTRKDQINGTGHAVSGTIHVTAKLGRT